MPKRESSRVVVVNDRKWKIGKFDALTGSYIAIKMISKISHVAVGIFAGNLTDKAVIAMAIANEIGTLTKQEFVEIQSECLHIIKEIEVVGDKEIESPVRLQDGRWGVKDMEDDALLIMTLVSHALLFNLTGFFDASALNGAKESFKGLMPLDAKTLMSTPSPQ